MLSISKFGSFTYQITLYTIIELELSFDVEAFQFKESIDLTSSTLLYFNSYPKGEQVSNKYLYYEKMVIYFNDFTNALYGIFSSSCKRVL
jgi:hypothetical protein